MESVKRPSPLTAEIFLSFLKTTPAFLKGMVASLTTCRYFDLYCNEPRGFPLPGSGCQYLPVATLNAGTSAVPFRSWCASNSRNYKPSLNL